MMGGLRGGHHPPNFRPRMQRGGHAPWALVASKTMQRGGHALLVASTPSSSRCLTSPLAAAAPLPSSGAAAAAVAVIVVCRRRLQLQVQQLSSWSPVAVVAGSCSSCDHRHLLSSLLAAAGAAVAVVVVCRHHQQLQVQPLLPSFVSLSLAAADAAVVTVVVVVSCRCSRCCRSGHEGGWTWVDANGGG